MYKIGSTNGSVTTRISKLYYNSHVDKRTITVVKTWDKLGYCEKYILADFEHILAPVSYTHLDVYKRQPDSEVRYFQDFAARMYFMEEEKGHADSGEAEK